MEWLQQNGFWIVVLVLFVLMHLGHGRGHGGHAEEAQPLLLPARPALPGPERRPDR